MQPQCSPGIPAGVLLYINNMISWSDFAKVDMRIGTIIEATPFVEARNPSYKLLIDFGEEIGQKKSSAQITERYAIEDLIGQQVVAVINFPAKQIANMMSECLVLGSVDEHGKDVILLQPQQPSSNGRRIS